MPRNLNNETYKHVNRNFPLTLHNPIDSRPVDRESSTMAVAPAASDRRNIADRNRATSIHQRRRGTYLQSVHRKPCTSLVQSAMGSIKNGLEKFNIAKISHVVIEN